MKQVNCPYIVRCIDVFIEAKTLHLVLQFCQGGDLKNFLKAYVARPLTERTIWRISLRIGLGLESRGLEEYSITFNDKTKT